jgi:hypothetical protein
MTSASVLARQLSELLDLAHPPVAVTFDAEPAMGDTEPIRAQPSGCCFWAPAEHRRLALEQGLDGRGELVDAAGGEVALLR